MSGGQLVVRDAVREDAEALARLWAGLLPRGTVDSAGVTPGERVAEALEVGAANPDSRIVVAELDGVVGGAAYLRVVRLSPLDLEPTMHVSHLQVDGALSTATVLARLLDGAVGWAEARGIGTLTAGSAATDRDTNRFLARLGLGQVGVLRATTLPTLRSRLVRDGAGRRGRSSPLRTVQVVAARRSQRRAQSGAQSGAESGAATGVETGVKRGTETGAEVEDLTS